MKKQLFVVLFLVLTLVLHAQNFSFNTYLSLKDAYQFSNNLVSTPIVQFSAKKILTEIVESQGQIKNDIIYKTVGLVTAEDGSEWVVAIDQSGRKAIVRGGNDVYTIYYTIEAQNPERLEYILSLTNMFSVDK